jgi:hypothetical protein
MVEQKLWGVGGRWGEVLRGASGCQEVKIFHVLPGFVMLPVLVSFFRCSVWD